MEPSIAGFIGQEGYTISTNSWQATGC